LERDIALLFETRSAPDFVEAASIEHGRIETRRIWCSTALNDHLDFPTSVRSFASRGNRLTRKPAKPVPKPHWVSPAAHSRRLRPNAYLPSTAANWGIEGVHYIIDWNYDEDRSQIRTGFGPENITRLRRFAIGIIESLQKPAQSIAEMMRKLAFNTRLVFDCLRMTQNSNSARPQGEQICPVRPGLGGPALFHKYVDSSIKSADDVTAFLKAPTLGMIPKL
jgi:hypothetical protein